MDSRDFRSHKDFTGLSVPLLDGLLKVSQLVRIQFNDWLGRFELNEGRHAVLVALDRSEEGCSQARLAEQLGQSESNVSTLIERMQRDGLVSRSKSESDRRKRILRITFEGRSVLASAESNRSAWANRMLRRVQPDECAQLLELLQRLAITLESANLTDAGTPASRLCIANSSHDEESALTEDAQSPQIALRRMLQALSSSAAVEIREKDAA